MNARLNKLFSICLWLFLSTNFCLQTTTAQEITFPSKAKVVDVTRAPYNARGDGITDDTQAIQNALNNYPDGEYIIYLPNGTYLISEQLEWPVLEAEEQSQRKVIMQGQTRDNTIIRLQANAESFQDTGNPRAMIRTGVAPADRFRNALRNLTLETGVNNPGVIGVQFMANKQGTLQNVTIRNVGNDGVIGLDFSYTDEIGPLLVKNVRIEGFDIGIRSAYELNSMTFEHIELIDQNQFGIFNEGQVLSIRGLRSEGKMPVIVNANRTATITLVDATLTGEGEAITETAIENHGTLFARNIAVSGYNWSIDNRNGFPQILVEENITEFISHEILKRCPTPDASLDLPIEETPSVAWGNPENDWVSIVDFGANSGDGQDDSEAIQQAIDSGATTIFIPPVGPYPFTFHIMDTVFVRGNVQRIIGTEGRIFGSGLFKIEEGTSPIVVIERMDRLGGGIVHTANRTLVLKQLGIKYFEGRTGAGDVFIEDVQGGPWYFKKQNVWARQLTTEVAGGAKITNNGSKLWILGLSTQRASTVIRTINGGKTEVLGAHIYTTSVIENEPMFLNQDGSVSLAGIRESNLYGSTYRNIVREIREGLVRDFTAEEAPQNNLQGSQLPLYVGYVPTVNDLNQAPKADAGEDLLTDIVHPVLIKADADDDGYPNSSCDMDVRWSVLEGGEENVIFDDSKALQPRVYFNCAGTYVLQMEVRDGEFTTTDDIQIEVVDRMISTGDHDGDGIPSGNGADATIQTSSGAGSTSNFGGGEEIIVQNFPSNRQKTYLRFDKSAFSNVITQATLSLQLSQEDVSNLPDYTFNVFALRELPDYGMGRLGEDWGEGMEDGEPAEMNDLTWNNAPANTPLAGGIYNENANVGGGVDNSQTTFLGTISLKDAEDGRIYFSTPELRNALNEDTNNLITLILTQAEISSEATIFASKEHPTLLPPMLLLNYDDALCADTFVPVAKFQSNYEAACEGTSVQFIDESIFTPTEWSWTFEGGTPANSTDPNPSVVFEEAGIYNVRLEISNANGSDVFEDKIEIVDIEGNTIPFVEDFEGGSNLWTIENPDIDDAEWDLLTDDDCKGRVIGMNNFDTDTRNTTDVFYANFDLSGYQKAFLQFDVAYSPYNDQFFDQFQVVAQTCEGEEYIVYDKGGFVLATAFLNEQFFLPANCEEWRTEWVDLSAFDGKIITLKFVNRGGFGNYLLVDNIEVNAEEAVGIEDAEASNAHRIWLNAHPNPNQGDFSLQFSSPKNGDVHLQITDLSGKSVYRQTMNYLQTHTIHSKEISLEGLPSGLYLLQLEQNGKQINRKLIVK